MFFTPFLRVNLLWARDLILGELLAHFLAEIELGFKGETGFIRDHIHLRA